MGSGDVMRINVTEGKSLCYLDEVCALMVGTHKGYNSQTEVCTYLWLRRLLSL